MAEIKVTEEGWNLQRWSWKRILAKLLFFDGQKMLQFSFFCHLTSAGRYVYVLEKVLFQFFDTETVCILFVYPSMEVPFLVAFSAVLCNMCVLQMSGSNVT